MLGRRAERVARAFDVPQHELERAPRNVLGGNDRVATLAARAAEQIARRLDARDIRVAGGVDNPTNYGSYAAGGGSPLQANRLPVPDPFRMLAVPSLSADPANVVQLHFGLSAEEVREGRF